MRKVAEAVLMARELLPVTGNAQVTGGAEGTVRFQGKAQAKEQDLF